LLVKIWKCKISIKSRHLLIKIIIYFLLENIKKIRKIKLHITLKKNDELKIIFRKLLNIWC